jgi:hypothetical protein
MGLNLSELPSKVQAAVPQVKEVHPLVVPHRCGAVERAENSKSIP